MIKALIELAPVVIKWPTGERLNEVWAGFENTSGFFKIIGAIDGIHINIPAPKNNPECYINRKGHHSIQLQVCLLFYSKFYFVVRFYFKTVLSNI